jgi:hypothetical protein
MLRKNNKDEYIFQCEYILKPRGETFYENSGCGVSGIPVVKPKEWKVGDIDTCSFCGREAINVKERTVEKPKEKRMIPIGEEYDITVSIDPIGEKCELIVFDRNENSYKLLKIGTVDECIKAAFKYENKSYKTREFSWCLPENTYYMRGNAFNVYGVYELDIDFTEFYEHY